MNAAIAKLADLFSPSSRTSAELVLNKLADVAVIAGSSAAYAAKGNILATTVADIDLFLLQYSSSFATIIDLIKEYFAVSHITIPDNTDYEEKHGNTHTSIVNVYLFNEPHFQLIQSDCSSAQELINQFDFGYIQVGIHKGEVYTGVAYSENEFFVSTMNVRFSCSVACDVFQSRLPPTETAIDEKQLETLQISTFSARKLGDFVDGAHLHIKKIVMTQEVAATFTATSEDDKSPFIIKKAFFVVSDGEKEFNVRYAAIDPSGVRTTSAPGLGSDGFCSWYPYLHPSQRVGDIPD